jgi:hypothetical protein
MEFKKWDSIPRLSKEEMDISEKIDGSSCAVRIRPYWENAENSDETFICDVGIEGEKFTVWAQSRNRFLKPTKELDNFGFAKWVLDHATELVQILGAGDHYGEWFGSGIQRRYGLSEKRFALFNARRWLEILHPSEDRFGIGLYIVPLLYSGPFNGAMINRHVELLRLTGSKAVLHEWPAEGLVVNLRQSKVSYKVLLENDNYHKWEVSE